MTKQHTQKIGAYDVTIVRMVPMDQYRLFGRCAPMMNARKNGDMAEAARGLSTETAQLALSTVTVIRPNAEGKVEKIDCTSDDMINRAFFDDFPTMMQVIGLAIKYQLGGFSSDSPAEGAPGEPVIPTPSL